MSDRKRKSINWTAVGGWIIFIGFLSLALYVTIPELGIVDCEGKTTTLMGVLMGCFIFTLLFIAGVFVGLPKNIPGGKGFLIDAIEYLYDKLDSDSQQKADEFLQKLKQSQLNKDKHL
jgi:hypothetical protein